METKNYFFTYLLFYLFLTEKILFLSNIFTFGKQAIKFHMCSFLFLHLAQWLFYMHVLLYFIKSSCCIYFYILSYNFLIFYFQWLLGVKTNCVFKTGLLSFHYWLLWLVWIHLIYYLTKAGSYKNIWPKLTNIFQVFHYYLLGRLAEIQLTFNQFLPRYNVINCFSNAFWMGQVNDCVHYMKTRMIENPF